MYEVNQVVVVRPGSGAEFCDVPALVIAGDGLRRYVQYASGRIEDVGVGNMREAFGWQVAAYWRMAADRPRYAA